MAMTQQVKSELATAPVPSAKARRAEVSAMLRFGGGLHLVGGRIVVEAEFDTAGAARRLRASIVELFGFDSELLMISAAGLRRGTRYTVRMIRHGEDVTIRYTRREDDVHAALTVGDDVRAAILLRRL